MSHRAATILIASVVCTTSTAAIFAQSPANPSSLSDHDICLNTPLTPNALNGGQAGFPEYHNVYIEPGSFDIYRKTGIFPDGTIFFKELQLTLPPAENPDGSRTEPSGRGYFPGAFNGADVTVKDSKRFADTGGWGYFNFNHHEPKAPTAKVKAKSECAFCHIGAAKRDEVWTQFYRILDEVPLPKSGKG
jgi:cytochrome P460